MTGPALLAILLATLAKHPPPKPPLLDAGARDWCREARDHWPGLPDRWERCPGPSRGYRT